MPRPQSEKVSARNGRNTAVISASVGPEIKKAAIANAKKRRWSLSTYIAWLIEEDVNGSSKIDHRINRAIEEVESKVGPLNPNQRSAVRDAMVQHYPHPFKPEEAPN